MKKIATWVYFSFPDLAIYITCLHCLTFNPLPSPGQVYLGGKGVLPQAVEVKWSWAASIILSWCCWAIVTQIIPLFDQHEGQVKIGTRGTCIIWSTMLDTPRKSRMIDHVIIFLCPYNLKKEVWPFVTRKTTWIQEKTGSKILQWMKQPTVMLWHHQPEKLEPLIGYENTSCPQRSISEIETTTPPGVPRYLSTFRSLPYPQAPSVPLSLWATVSTGASSSETWCFSCASNLGVFSWRFFWPSQKCWHPKMLLSRLSKTPISGLSFKKLACCGHLLGFVATFSRFQAKKWCCPLVF